MSDKPTEIIRAEEAQITTATVTIKTIRVGKKQLTLTLFRQLPQVNLVDVERCALNGEVWGWVNYHWGKDQVGTHFILQWGTVLCRALFEIKPARQLAQQRRSHIHDMIDEGDRCLIGAAYKRSLESGVIVPVEVLEIEHLAFRAERSRRRAGEPLSDDERQRFASQLSGWKMTDKTADEIDEEAAQRLGSACLYAHKWDRLMAKLDAVEQLYLAG